MQVTGPGSGESDESSDTWNAEERRVGESAENIGQTGIGIRKRTEIDRNDDKSTSSTKQ